LPFFHHNDLSKIHQNQKGVSSTFLLLNKIKFQSMKTKNHFLKPPKTLQALPNIVLAKVPSGNRLKFWGIGNLSKKAKKAKTRRFPLRPRGSIKNTYLRNFSIQISIKIPLKNTKSYIKKKIFMNIWSTTW